MIQVFELQMGEDWTEVDMISFVDDPAIKTPFLKFKNENPFQFAAIEDRRIVTGPVLIPDLIIPRRVEDVMFNVVFRAEQIKKVYDKFMQSKSYSNANFMHKTELSSTDDCHLYECFLSDNARGVNAPEKFSDLPDHTWFMSYKITDDSLWQMIKDGKITGYSIEGRFKMIPTNGDAEGERVLQELDEILSQIENS